MQKRFCKNCNHELKYLNGISVLNPIGNEEDYRYFYCENEDKYFVDVMEDVFLGPEIYDEIYEMSNEKAIGDLKLINKCPDPNNKNCKCSLHTSWYRFG